MVFTYNPAAVAVILHIKKKAYALERGYLHGDRLI